MDTTHWIALGLSLLQAVGNEGTGNDLPALGPALVVHIQVGGDFARCCSTWRGIAGGVKRALKVPLGKAWKRRPTSERRIVHGDDMEHSCLSGGEDFPTGDDGGCGSRGILDSC